MTSQEAYRKADELSSQAAALRNQSSGYAHQREYDLRAADACERDAQYWYAQASKLASGR
jgi:uncharacterized protein YccT (UPF0319 family)